MLAILYELAVLNFSMWPFLDFLGVPVFFYASVPLMISVSVFLARHFATTNRDLASRLEQVRELSEKTLAQELERARLEADNERKNKELEEARNLQLSMLPHQAPVLARYEIAFYMQTATEVGGDYYDFHMEDTGLTLVIGDATGHGMRAGAMVAAGKGAFHAYSGFHPGQLLGKMCGALKKMNLKGMFMAMAAVKLYENKAILANAGMPGSILYRSKNESLEVIGEQGPPLGSLAFFPYRETELILEDGDVLVFQSDGLPERFNKEDQLFGMDRVLKVIQQRSQESAKQLIEALVEGGVLWSGGDPG